MGRRVRTSGAWRLIVAAGCVSVLGIVGTGGTGPLLATAASSPGARSAQAAPAYHGTYHSTEFPPNELEAAAGPAQFSEVAPQPQSAQEAPLPKLLAQPGHHEHVGPNGEVDVTVCSDQVPPGYAHCNAHIRTDSKATSATPAAAGQSSTAATIGNNGAYDPSYLQSAYNAPSGSGGSGQTIAIVDAYDNPNVEADLGYYRSFWGLPPCTTANGCFRKSDENGGNSYPRADTGWASEIALDVDMASAMCPNCKIVLVEANSSYTNDLGTAVNTAVNVFHANAVSNSYGGSEYSSQTSDEVTWYKHPGVAVTASSGDSGYGVEFPAASQYVTAVGGTSLVQSTNTGTRNASETAWSGAGSGCSSYDPKPSWQHDSGCARRTVADVSAVADPNTGVWVYNTYGDNGWAIYGGTSVASPIVASMYALAGNGSSTDNLASYPYGSAGILNDVTSGSNGRCSVGYLCTSVVGYDGPTGLGTPNGTPPFRPAAPTVPGAPTGLTAAAGDKQVTLSWTAPSGTTTSYNVYRGTTSGGETLQQSGVSGTSFTDTGLTDGTTYYYEVAAVNGVGESARSNEASATPATATPPSQPQSVAAHAVTNTISVTWAAPASSGGSAVTGYNVYRSTTAGGEGTTAYASGISGTSFTDTGVAAGATYYYVVTAVNGVGEGARSAETSATANNVPSQITNLSARTSSSRGVRLTWSAPGNGGATISGYRIYRSTSSGTETLYVTVTCSSSSCSYNDSGTTRNRIYYYQVAAYNAVGQAALSNESSARAR